MSGGQATKLASFRCPSRCAMTPYAGPITRSQYRPVPYRIVETPLNSTGLDLREGLRIVLVGRTGSGKSATANTILGRDAFREDSSSVSVTIDCQKQSGQVDGTRVHVIDTPGLFDTDIPEEELKKEIAECVKMSVPGPHAFLLVIRLGVRFTKEERNAVKWISDNFGGDASKYTIILFTFKDQADAGKALRECKELDELAKTFGNRTHAFNNKDARDHVQVSELIKKIKEMVKSNEGKYYTNKMYKEAQRKLREEAERRKKEEEQRIEAKRQKEKWNRNTKICIALAAAVVLLVAGVIIAVAADSTVARALGAPALVLGLMCMIAAICMCRKVGGNRHSDTPPV